MARRGVLGFGLRLVCLVLAVLGVYCKAQDNVIRFNRGEIYEIIKIHNDLRRSVNDAANMRELSWNEGLAIASSEWGSNCEYVARPDRQWGQNLRYFQGNDYHRSPVHLFRMGFGAWANDSVHDDYRKSVFCGQNGRCSHVQLIAGDVQQVGCSIVQCPSLAVRGQPDVRDRAKLLVCFYTPWVDLTTRELYVSDKRCATCPAGTRCIDQLCSARRSLDRYVPSIGKPIVDISVSSTSDTNIDAVIASGLPVQQSSQRYDDRRRRQHRNKHKHHRVADNHVTTSNAATPDNTTAVVYQRNNRVMPFPGRSERRDIRRIERAEIYLQQHDPDEKNSENPAVGPAHNNTLRANSRKKRQLSYQDAVYLRRIEYERYRQDYERHMRQREMARRTYEEELRRRHSYAYRLQELRRAGDRARYDEERRRRRRLREQRRRLEALALVQAQGFALDMCHGEMTGEEQFFTVSAHNLLRREVGARELAWSTNLERWAKYVIRCETEYPGPITCYTNFGQCNQGDSIYNTVYQWGSEGYDMARPLLHGCRTPYDKRLCNHNSIIRDKSLTQMACAARSCGMQRQLTCIYNSA